MTHFPVPPPPVAGGRRRPTLLIAAASIVLLLGLAAAAYFFLGRFGVRECYAMTGLRLITTDNYALDGIVLAVRPRPAAAEAADVAQYELILPDGTVRRAATVMRFKEDKPLWVLFSIREAEVEAGGLKLRHAGSRAVSIPSPIFSRKVEEFEDL